MKEDRVYLVHILETITNIEDLTADGHEVFEAAKHDRAAALYYLQTMAESTQRLSDDIKATHPEIDWTAISGFRNRLAHGYLEVNINIVWNIIENDLPALKLAVEVMLQSMDNSNSE